jgi:hypothetical protein
MAESFVTRMLGRSPSVHKPMIFRNLIYFLQFELRRIHQRGPFEKMTGLNMEDQLFREGR